VGREQRRGDARRGATRGARAASHAGHEHPRGAREKRAMLATSKGAGGAGREAACEERRERSSEPRWLRAEPRAGEISFFQCLFLQYIQMHFFLVPLRFDLICESFCQHPMESSVVRYNHMTMREKMGNLSGR
jgi:hypothetical protein